MKHVFACTGLLAAIFVSGCVTRELPKPTVSLMKQGETYFIDSVEITGMEEAPTEKMVGHFHEALSTVPALKNPQGKPVTLRINITNLHDVTPGEALWVGGINSINANFSLHTPKKKDKIFEIALAASSANYAPGGILGLIAEAASDDEPKLVRGIMDQFEHWVLIKQRVLVKRGITTAALYDTSGAAPAQTASATPSSSAPDNTALSNSERTTKPGNVPKPFVPETVTLANGAKVCDLTGKWDAQYYHATGLYEDLVTFRMHGGRFTSTKSESHPWLEAGEEWFKGTLKPGGFSDFKMQQSTGWVDVPVEINSACNVIELRTVNGGVALQKREPETPRTRVAAAVQDRDSVPENTTRTTRRSNANRRLVNSEIIAVFSDRYIGNYLGDWRIEFSRNRKWDGVITRWNQADGYGTWTAKGNKHCLKITDVEAKGYEILDDGAGCYAIWLDFESGDLTMIAPKVSSKPILIETGVFIDGKQASAN